MDTRLLGTVCPDISGINPRQVEIRLLKSTLREEGKALVTQATDEQSQQTNAVTYIQVFCLKLLTILTEPDLFPPLQNLLELKDRFDSFLNNSFSNDKFFKQVSLSLKFLGVLSRSLTLIHRSSRATLSTSST